MANIKVDVRYEKDQQEVLDPVFEETFAFELQAYLNEEFKHTAGDICVAYLPGGIKDRFEITSGQNSGVKNQSLYEEIRKRISAFKVQNNDASDSLLDF